MTNTAAQKPGTHGAYKGWNDIEMRGVGGSLYHKEGNMREERRKKWKYEKEG
jgi:hypothetical protein